VRDAATVYSLQCLGRCSRSSSAFARGDSFSLGAWSNYENMTAHIVCQRFHSPRLPWSALTWMRASRPGRSGVG